MSADGLAGGATAMREWAGSLDRLHTIAVPTLILVGERDNFLGVSRQMHERIDGSRLVILRNTGHGTNLFRPEAFSNATLGFLAAVEQGEDVAGEYAID